MAVKTLYKTINTNGEYSCGDIGVTTEEWLDLLNDEKSKPYHEALLCFLRQKEHKATCVKVSQVYGSLPSIITVRCITSLCGYKNA